MYAVSMSNHDHVGQHHSHSRSRSQMSFSDRCQRSEAYFQNLGHGPCWTGALELSTVHARAHGDSINELQTKVSGSKENGHAIVQTTAVNSTPRGPHIIPNHPQPPDCRCCAGRSSPFSRKDVMCDLEHCVHYETFGALGRTDGAPGTPCPQSVGLSSTIVARQNRCTEAVGGQKHLSDLLSMAIDPPSLFRAQEIDINLLYKARGNVMEAA